MATAFGLFIWVIAVLMYGSSYAGVSQGLKHLSPGVFQLFRMIFGLAMTLIIIAGRYIINKHEYRQTFRAHLTNGIKPIAWTVFGGLLNLGIPHVLIAVAQQWLPSCAVTLMCPFQTSCGAVFAHFMLDDEKINIYKIISVVLSVVGIVCNAVPAFRNSGDDGNATTMQVLLGYVLLVVGMCMFGICLPIFRKKCPHVDSSISVAIQLVASVAFEGLWSLIFDGAASVGKQLRECPPMGWVWPALVGALVSGVAINLYMIINETMGSFACNLVPFGQVIVGLLIGVLMLGEWDPYVTWEIVLNIIGCVILLGALVVGFLKPTIIESVSDKDPDDLDDIPTAAEDNEDDKKLGETDDRVLVEL